MGLDTTATLERLGPLTGATVALDSVGPVAVTRALWSLVCAGEPIAPYSMGVVTRAWGRGKDGVALRCLRLHRGVTLPGTEPWSTPMAWYASFPYDGPLTRIEAASTWIASQWVPRAGLRLGYGPLMALVEGVPDWRGGVRASIHLAIAAIPTR